MREGLRSDPDEPRGRCSRRSEKRAFEHQRTVMMGRTHGVHAEPMTFGLKLALWFAELGRAIDRVDRAREGICVGKISGAVGYVRPPRSAYRSGSLPPARSAARAGVIAGHPARSACRVALDVGPHRRLAREVRARSPRPAENRNRRGRRAVRQGAEGLVGDAPQAKSDWLRADRRPGAPASWQCDGSAWRTSRSGTSATFRTRRSNA